LTSGCRFAAGWTTHRAPPVEEEQGDGLEAIAAMDWDER
jgi:hypothetical protein